MGIKFILIFFSLILGLTTTAHANRCADQLKAGHYDFHEAKDGLIVFTESGIQYYPDDASQGSRTLLYTDPSHLAVLKRQVGEERFKEIMAARNPEAAAAKVIEDIVQDEISEGTQDIENSTAQTLSSQEISELVDKVLSTQKNATPVNSLKKLSLNEFFALVDLFRSRNMFYIDEVDMLYSRHDWTKKSDEQLVQEPVLKVNTQVILDNGTLAPIYFFISSNEYKSYRVTTHGSLEEKAKALIAETLGLDDSKVLSYSLRDKGIFLYGKIGDELFARHMTSNQYSGGPLDRMIDIEKFRRVAKPKHFPRHPLSQK